MNSNVLAFTESRETTQPSAVNLKVCRGVNEDACQNTLAGIIGQSSVLQNGVSTRSKARHIVRSDEETRHRCASTSQ